jgi:hypothetical protein
MVTNTIRSAVRECGIPSYRTRETTDAIIRGAHRTFVILILMRKPELISTFIEHDQLQHSQLDHKLPHRREYLEALLPDNVAGEFEKKQWELTCPVFHTQVFPRVLEDNIILPFTQDRKIGYGGFGDVYEVTLVAGHQEEEPRVVRSCQLVFPFHGDLPSSLGLSLSASFFF